MATKEEFGKIWSFKNQHIVFSMARIVLVYRINLEPFKYLLILASTGSYCTYLVISFSIFFFIFVCMAICMPSAFTSQKSIVDPLERELQTELPCECWEPNLVPL